MNGFKLKRLRESKNMLQKDLAKELNIAPTTISGYELETREPDNETLKKIANYFNVTIDYLLDNENSVDKSEYELREKINFTNFLIRNKYLKKDETFTDKDIDSLINFININKEYIKSKH